MRSKEYVELVDAIYGVVIDPKLWPSALKLARPIFGASAAAILGLDKKNRKIRVLASSNIDTQMVESFNEEYALSSVRTNTIISKTKVDIYYDYLHTTEKGMNNDKFYDWLQRWDRKYYIAGTLIDDEDVKQYVIFHRSAEKGHVQKEDIRHLKAIRPHFQRALQICRHVDEADLDREASWELIEKSPHGVVVLDERLRVLYVNAEAERIFYLANGIKLDGKRLIATMPSDNTKLQELLADTARIALQQTESARPATFSLDRPSGERPIVAVATPFVWKGRIFAGRSPTVLVFLRDTDREQDNSLAGFCRSYGLTPAETNLVSALAAEDTIKSFSENEGISGETVRWHLKNIFTKTGSNRQSQLVTLLHKALMPPK